MEMNEIYVELEEKKAKIMKRVEALEEELKKERGNLDAITMAMESLEQLGNFKPSEDEEKQLKKAAEKEEENKNLVWKHKTAIIVKFGRDGTKLGSYPTKKKLAEQLGVSQSMINYYMKQPESIQLKKRGYVLRYEY